MPIYNPTGSLPYRVYTALMSQSGIAAPTAIIIQNTIGAINWVYNGIGVYGGGLIGAFTINKTWVTFGDNGTFSGSDPDRSFFEIYQVGLNNIGLESQIGSGGTYISADDLMSFLPIEIRVYP